MSGIPAAVVPVVLLAALLHATWNAMAHAVPDRLIAFALIGTAYLIAGGAMAAATPLPAAGSWVYLIASVLLHVLYNLLLMRSFMLGDFGQVYPLARGTAVAVVAVLATVAVGEAMPPIRLVGVVLVCVGLAALVAPLGRTAHAELPAVVAALGTGVMIAGYTTVDGVGVRGSGSVLGYTGWLFLLQGAALPILAYARRGRGLARQARPYLLAGLAGGVLSLTAYGLVLWAQTRAPLAPVAALRETSSLMGAIIAAVVFKESFGRRRVLAAVVVTVGVVLTNL
ncbi:MAG TPA: EamA family transporter [Mycobacteriales bacterium]|nr:EamA family transporter [Mycobacteriales bacterium]